AAAPDGDSRCAVRTPGGITRWRLLGGTSELLFQAPVGHHARVALRAFSESPDSEHVVHIAGVPVTVHSLAGLSAHVAVAPGTHRVEVHGPGPVLARIPGGAEAPCASLRQQVHFARSSPSARYLLDPDATPTVLRVRLRS